MQVVGSSLKYWTRRRVLKHCRRLRKRGINPAWWSARYEIVFYGFDGMEQMLGRVHRGNIAYPYEVGETPSL
jgi:hypothetical protein